jgi:F420-dependent oxidoreductase-like protein
VLVRIGINGSGLLARPSIDAIVEHARQAAQDGFASYWLAQGGPAEALTLLALAAREAPDIELGTAVVPTYPRHPSALACQAMTTQAATGGRLALGIGLSHKPVIEGSYGMSFEKPIRHMREYLSILIPLLEEGKVSFAGETLTGRGELQVPGTDPPPVLLAALGPQMLRLAGSRSAGTILWLVGPRTVREHIVPRISEAAAKAGRGAPRVVAGLPVCVTDDPERTRERLGRAFALYGQLPSYRAMLDREGAESPPDVCVVGGEAEVRDHLAALADAGATDLAALEFCKTDDERTRTRELLRSLL